MADQKTRRPGTHRPQARRPAPRRPVVAEVLADGTIRPVADGKVKGGGDRYAVGTVNGDGWVLWWERRRLEDAG